MGRTLREIELMPYAEFIRWQAFYQIEPFGVRRDNLHAAMIASTVANCHSKKKFTTTDFMVNTEPKNETQNFISRLRVLAHGKKD